MKYDYHLAVIGAGSGGLVASSGCANFGAKIALIESAEMGGDCLNSGCVPSKAFLKIAHTADAARKAGIYGLNLSVNKSDDEKIFERVSKIISEIAPRDSQERFEKMGVDVFRSECKIIDKHTIELDSKRITAKNILISTGSSPAEPPIPGLNEVPYHTNRTIFKLKKIPGKLVILGAGPIGIELGQAFAHLGTKVEIIDHATSLFGKDDEEVGPLMIKVFERDGIKFNLGADIMVVENTGERIKVKIKKDGKESYIEGDTLLVALGRTPNTKNLGLEELGLNLNKRGFIQTDARLRTNIKNIYACGDCAGPFLFTHMAAYQAGIVIRNVIFGLPAKASYSNIAWTTYSKPEVAHVGYTEQEAKKMNILKDTVMVNLSEVDRAMAEEDREGFLKLIIGKGGRLIGATLVGEKAGEMIPVASLAITQKMKAGVFANIIFSYPTEAEIFKTASYEHLRKKLKPWIKTIIQKIFLS